MSTNASDISDSALSGLKAVSLLLLIVWTIAANGLVFVVLYQNPKLRTVPNLLVANLAFSDFMLGLIVLPFSATYTVVGRWIFGEVICEMWLSCDVLICTSSIWNLSMVGLDRYWAITSPVKYMNKRTVKSAALMIAGVWGVSAAISLAPLAGWKQFSQQGNYFRSHKSNDTFECSHFEDLPSFTIYSATGSFYIPMFLMFYVYYCIYKAFLDHQIRQHYRHNVLRKHLESTILRDLSHVMPDDDPAKLDLDDEDSDDDSDDSSDSDDSYHDREAVQQAIDDEYRFHAGYPEAAETTPLTQSAVCVENNDRHEAEAKSDQVTVLVSNTEVKHKRVLTHKPSMSYDDLVIVGPVAPELTARHQSHSELANCIEMQVTGFSGKQPEANSPNEFPHSILRRPSNQSNCNAETTENGVRRNLTPNHPEVTAQMAMTTENSDATKHDLGAGKKHHHHHLTSQVRTNQPAIQVAPKPLNKNLFGLDLPAVTSNQLVRSPGPPAETRRPSNQASSPGHQVRKELVFNVPDEESETVEVPIDCAETSVASSAGETRCLPIRHHVPPPLKKLHSAKSLEPKKPKAISAAKEKRGVKVLGIILGCFTLCWLPFFIMYLVAAFCSACTVNIHVEQFITWLGYANSAMNPIIYTVFNRDYQNALRRLVQKQNRLRPSMH